MQPRSLVVAAAVAALALVSGSAPPSAEARRPIRGPSYSLEVVAGGVPLAELHHRGRTWVEGVCDARFALRITNHTARRVEVVVSVDGRDVIDGESADYVHKRGYLLGPHESYDIPGFRTSWDTAAAFRFSSVRDSYAARRGDPRNVGVIGAAFFPERRRVTRPRPIAPRHRHGRAGAPPPATLEDEAAPRDDVAAREPAAKRGDAGATIRRRTRPQRLGTGWGEAIHSSVVEVPFERARERRPDAVITIWYDDRAGLLAKGVPVPPDCCDPPPPCGWPSCRDETPRPFAVPPR